MKWTREQYKDEVLMLKYGIILFRTTSCKSISNNIINLQAGL